jgi:uncharacterized protein
VDRLFLDANILFSASYREDAGVAVLWSLENVGLFSSSYAIEEAKRNLVESAQRKRLERLTEALHLVQASSAPEAVGGRLTFPRRTGRSSLEQSPPKPPT